MNPKIKKLWIKALRSGKYKQGHNLMCHGGPQGARHCCLGVLSELAVSEGICSRREAFHANLSLNEPVQEWAEITDEGAIVASGQYAHLSAITLNDEQGLSFKEIADVLESGDIK